MTHNPNQKGEHMIDPRLNDLGWTDHERRSAAHVAGLIAADHPQLWKDSALKRAMDRRMGFPETIPS